MRKTVRVLFLNVSSNLGGTERSVLEEAKSLKGSDIEPIIFLVTKGPLIKELKANQIKYIVKPVSNNLLSMTREFSFVKNFFLNPYFLIDILRIYLFLVRYIKRKKIEVVISNNIKMHLITPLLKIYPRPRIIWSYHDNLPKSSRLKALLIILANIIPSKIIVNSNFVKSQWSKYVRDTNKLITLYPIINHLKFLTKKTTLKKSNFGLTNKDYVIGNIGVLVKWKGQEVLIKAAKLIRGRIPNLKVLIIGGNIYDSDSKDTSVSLIDLVKKYHLEEKVVFTGFIHENHSAIKLLDLVVHTSIEPEPFGRIIVESMLAKRTIIGANAGGVKETLEPINGYLVEPNNPRLLAKMIINIYNHRQSSKSLNDFQKYALDKFCNTLRTDQLIKVIQE